MTLSMTADVRSFLVLSVLVLGGMASAQEPTKLEPGAVIAAGAPHADAAGEIGTVAEAADYSRREACAPQLAEFQGGGGEVAIVIVGLLVIILVVLVV